MMDKKELRKKAKDLRNKLDMKMLSEKIVRNIRKSEIYKLSKNVLIFYPLKHEVNLLPLLSDDKNFFLPKVNGAELEICPYSSGEELMLSSFNTKEPVSVPVNPDLLDLIFVPALLVDNNLYRLGYGGGFYDRFLSKNALKAVRAVALPSVFCVEALPVEEFDEKLNVKFCE